MRFFYLLFITSIFSLAEAQELDKSQNYQKFTCGSAWVYIESWGEFENARALVTISNKGRDTKLWLHSVDYIGGECQLDKWNRERIIIQAFCGGSGCSNNSFGVIEPETLRISLVPVISAGGKNNIQVAEEILGKKINSVPKIISVGDYSK